MRYPITTIGNKNWPPRGSHKDVYEITESEYKISVQNNGRIPDDIIQKYVSDADWYGYGIGLSTVEKNYEFDDKTYPFVGIIQVYNNCD